MLPEMVTGYAWAWLMLGITIGAVIWTLFDPWDWL